MPGHDFALWTVFSLEKAYWGRMVSPWASTSQQKRLTSARSCVLHGRILSLKQDATHLHYRVTWPKASAVSLASKPQTKSSTDDDTESLIRHYFNLTPNLTELYERWSKADSNFKKRASKFTGVRIMKQDAWEALIGFICSSNNNIVRISQMVSHLKFKLTCANSSDR